MTIAEFLLARIAEDEADADQVAHDIGRWQREKDLTGPDGRQGSVVVANLLGSACDPARTLAECEAKRRIVEEYKARDEDVDLMLGPSVPRQREWSGLRLAVRTLASVYADHPDYRQEWSA